MKQGFAFLIAIILLASCQVNYQKSPSGLRYKIYPAKTAGKQVKEGDYIKFHIEYVLQRNGAPDTILNSSYGKLPGYISVDTGKMVQYSFIELLPKTKTGDSLVFIISVDSLKSKQMIPDYNHVLKQGYNVLGKVKILSVFDNQEQMMEDYEAESKKIKDQELADVENYLKKNNINAVKTTNGAFVKIDNPGGAVKADTGMQATVTYKGMLMENKNAFDSGTIDVNVGEHRVILGWEECLPYFGEGGKGTLYIPSSLGYGSQGAPPSIPPFANLMFEIEVNKVEKAKPSEKQNSLTPEMIQEMINQQKAQQK